MALGVPLLGASSAQAVVGEGNSVITNNPDGLTATISQPFNKVVVCYDHNVDLVNNAIGQMLVGGYSSVAFQASTSALTTNPDPKCIEAQFASSDLEAATVVTVLAGTVANTGSPAQVNITDSFRLIGSTSHVGTRGHNQGPVLTTAIPDNAQNQLAYVYDKDVLPAGSGVPNNVCDDAVGTPEYSFGFYDNQGGSGSNSGAPTPNGLHTGGAFVTCTSTTIGSEDFGVVVLDYDPAAGAVPNPAATNPESAASVANARRAFVLPGTNTANNLGAISLPPAVSRQSFASVIVTEPGSSNDPDLLTNELASPSQSLINFTYDENIANYAAGAAAFNGYAGAPANWPAANFYAVHSFSNGGPPRTTFALGAAGANLNAAVAEANFGPPADLLTEFWTNAANTDCAVTGAGDNQCAPPNGLQAGGNNGAFSLGYTTGAEPKAGRSTTATTVTITMDQRMVNAPGVGQLVDDQGLTGVFCTPTSFGGLNPGPNPLTFSCPASDLASAVGIFLPGILSGGPVVVTTPILAGSPDGFNLDQVISIR